MYEQLIYEREVYTQCSTREKGSWRSASPCNDQWAFAISFASFSILRISAAL